ncbi:MAG: RNA polymerase sigma factor, partial [Gemmatimonadales bacterium]
MSTPLRRFDVSRLPDAANRELEHAWVSGIAAGDEAAFEAVFRQYNRHLYQFARRLMHNADEAEDVVQAVFLTIWQNRATWTVRGSLRAY